MANTAQSKKRARQAEVRRENNTAQRSTLRTFIKKVIHALQAKNKEAAQGAYKTAQKLIDRAATKGLIHANTAARIKSRLNKRVKTLVLG